MLTNPFSAERTSWPVWAEFLRERRLENLAAWALEAAGPLTVLAAQALYLGSPFLRSAFSTGQMDALAGMLEDHREVIKFTAFLREETPS